MKNLGLPLPNSLNAMRGRASQGVYRTEATSDRADKRVTTLCQVRHSKLDLIVELEDKNQLVLFKETCAWEPLVMEREREKREKYGELARQRIGCRVSTIPLMVGDPGLLGGGLDGHIGRAGMLKKDEGQALISSLQREVLCSAVRIIKRFMKEDLSKEPSQA